MKQVRPIEIVDVERLNTAVATITDSGVPLLLVRGQMSDLVTGERAQTFSAASRASNSLTSPVPGTWWPVIATPRSPMR